MALNMTHQLQASVKHVWERKLVWMWWRRVNSCWESNSSYPGYYSADWDLWRQYEKWKIILGIPTVYSRNDSIPRVKNDDIKVTTYVLQYDVMNQRIAHAVPCTSQFEVIKLLGKRAISVYGERECRHKISVPLMK
jgi:hypothetical protein